MQFHIDNYIFICGQQMVLLWQRLMEKQNLKKKT